MLAGVPAPPPPGFEDIQRQELSGLFGRMVGLRLGFIPVAVALCLFVALREPARWRTALLAGLLLGATAYFLLELVRFRRRGLAPHAIPANLLAAIVVQGGLALATGGLESPFTYTFVPVAALVGLFASRRAHLLLSAAQLAAVWGLAALTLSGAIPDLNLELFGGGARPGHGDVHLVTSAALLSLVLVLASRVGALIRRVFDAMLARALEARHDALRAHAERAEELTLLSAEIAHELKNPLASVKGLAALLAGGVPPGKPAERLGVLRREVDRMGGILEGFLDFSRPLAPLALAPVDLGALARDVAALHEGLASERGLRLVVEGVPAPARCDARKVRGAIMNLVQNAIEASPPGGEVTLRVACSGGEARVAVLDRGPGLDPALGERVFLAGVTSKARGSGLGLTMARALARQHGGEVTLRAREGGGCEAVLALPTGTGTTTATGTTTTTATTTANTATTAREVDHPEPSEATASRSRTAATEPPTSPGAPERPLGGAAP
jgi:signal transduction histidine kinase